MLLRGDEQSRGRRRAFGLGLRTRSAARARASDAAHEARRTGGARPQGGGMTFEEFMYYLEAYGASLQRWPRELRETAQAFLAASPAAGAARAETARLDALLDRLELVPDKASKARVEAHTRALATRVAAGPSGRFSLGAGARSLWSRAA